MSDNNNYNKNNNQEIDDKYENMTINTNDGNITHDHEAFIHQIRLFSGLTDQELKSVEKGKGGLV